MTALKALQEATHDPDPVVADAARNAFTFHTQDQSPSSAVATVDNLSMNTNIETPIADFLGKPELQRLAHAKRGFNRMLRGLALVIIGSCITFASYFIAAFIAASNPVGSSYTYTICWGAIVVGVLYSLSGMFEWLTNR